jgi:hypothetical protein
MASWDEVVSIGERLPGVEAGTWWGTPGLLVRAPGQSKGKGFCRLRTNPDAWSGLRRSTTMSSPA